MRKESAIIRKCSAQRTGEPFHYASIQHILSNVMNAGILRSGETKSEVFPELQIVSLEQFNRVAKTREQRSVNYAIKCGGTTETVQLEDGTEATVVRPPRAYPRKIVGKALLSGNVYCGHCGGRIFAATARKTHRPTESNERIAIYKCYNRSQHKGQCDGPCFYIVDAVGVTEHDKTIPKPKEPGGEQKPKVPTLERLLEYLSHGEVSDDNLALLRDYCASINMRYENNVLFGRHLNIFISDYGFAPKTLAYQINTALSQGTLPPFTSASNDNSARNSLISCLMLNLDARKKLLELHRGYYAIAPGEDEIIDKGFTKEAAKSFIDSFEKYLNDNADKIEALRIIYNSEDTVITYSMLSDLRDKLLSENRLFTPYNIWSNYKMLDMNGDVEDLDVKQNIKALTHLIQLVRYAYKKTDNLKSLLKGYSQRFTLYCGQAQRPLSPDQQEIMKAIADYIINEGSISVTELNSIDTDLWRKAVKSFGIPALTAEMIDLSKFILKAA